MMALAVILLSVALVSFSGLLSQAHHVHVHPDQLFKAQCRRAAENNSTFESDCINCFNDSKVQPLTPAPDEDDDDHDEWVSTFRFTFHNPSLTKCIKDHLGSAYDECTTIETTANREQYLINSARIVECCNAEFNDIISRDCQNQVEGDDFDEYVECKRKAFIGSD